MHNAHGVVRKMELKYRYIDTIRAGSWTRDG